MKPMHLVIKILMNERILSTLHLKTFTYVT